MSTDLNEGTAAAPEWQLSPGLSRCASFILAAVFALAVMAYAIFDKFDVVRFGPFVVALTLLQALLFGRLLILRELLLYMAFVAYATLSLLWAPDRLLAMNSYLPALCFPLVLLLYSSMLMYGERRAVVAGALLGFLVGATYFTATSHFPFVYPDDFPYNAVASTYLFGLFTTCLWGWQQRWRFVPIALGMMTMVLIAATTSIKTNLGIMLGATAAALVYPRRSLRALRRSVLLLLMLGAILIYALATTQGVVDQLIGGVVRVTTGAQVLTTKDKEQDASQLGLETREHWKDEGLKGWLRNPVLGYGVEAFRSDIGITSHSTPVDLLYNFGIIGFGLFYSIFASVALRLLHARRADAAGPQPLILAGLVCYAFISLSGTLFYNALLAVFVATAGVLAGPEVVPAADVQMRPADVHT
jgi:hypothetical protein